MIGLLGLFIRIFSLKDSKAMFAQWVARESRVTLFFCSDILKITLRYILLRYPSTSLHPSHKASEHAARRTVEDTQGERDVRFYFSKECVCISLNAQQGAD